MKRVYEVLAFLVAIEVVVQASLMVWGVAGLGLWVDDGNELTKDTFEDAFNGGERPFPEFLGLMLHGMNGMMVIPAIALLALIASFFSKVPKAPLFSLAVLLLVVAQVTLGLFGHSHSELGALHGINALVLFSTAAWTGIRTHRYLRTA